ncbi:protein phosphatase 2C domain-containing protein (plasmid) [Streptomyces sp. NBC_01186]|uniref:PP2C family protein-serine/threonine phosphatase n=1 Tax=Streptomyces sp. NBC_01186 TaxID=2903765 RepID=UPI002E0DBB75|nr:protein phosphatase 2C domain-containing protein [Streptomyces sp. NBC_01186]
MPAHAPQWRSATVSDQGPRRYMADAAAHWRVPHGHQAWAVADGIGDEFEAAEATRRAVLVAARRAPEGGAAAGVLRARAHLQYFYDGAPRGQKGDCVMVVAVPLNHAAEGLDVAWVGDCRVYVVQDGEVRQVTEDHTVGQSMRRGGDPYFATPAPGYDHIVERSVLSDTEVASARVTGPVERVLLCSDGVSKAVPNQVVSGLLTAPLYDASFIARSLVSAARAYGSRDNAAATVLLRPRPAPRPGTVPAPPDRPEAVPAATELPPPLFEAGPVPECATSYTRSVVQLAAWAGLRPEWRDPYRSVRVIALNGTGPRATFGTVSVGARSGRVLRAQFIHGPGGEVENHEGPGAVREALSRICSWTSRETGEYQEPR